MNNLTRRLNQTGIDRTILTSKLVSFDDELLLSSENVELELSASGEVEAFTIEEEYYNLKANVRRSKHGVSSITAIIKLSIARDGINVFNANVECYKKILKQALEELRSKYGVLIEYSSIEFKSIEINRTLSLDKPFKCYERVLKVLESALTGWRDGEDIKSCIWKSNNYKSLDYETLYFNRSSMSLKIYNKAKYLQDKSITDAFKDYTLMRFEYTLSKRNCIESALGSCKVCELTQYKLESYFDSRIEKDIIKNLKKYKDEYMQELRELIRESRQDNHWSVALKDEINRVERVENRVILFDIADILKALKLENLDENVYSLYQNARRTFKIHGDLIDNNSKLREILKLLVA